MKNSISFRQYRSVDLTLFAVILIISEFIIVKASTSWFADQLYVVSPVAAVTAIVMMRWGIHGLIHAALGGAVYGLLCGGDLRQLIVYTIGNLLSAGALLFLKKVGKQETRKDTWLTMAYGTAVQLLMLFGRALVALITGLGGSAALGLITTDILSIVFTLVILWIARRVNGLFEDQKHYLLRLQHELREEEAGPGNNGAGFPKDDHSGRGIQP